MQWRDDTTFSSIRPICEPSECLNDRLGFELGHRRYPLNVRFARKRTSIRALAMSHKCHEPTFAIDDIPNCACHQATDTSTAATRLGAERCCNFMGTPDRERCDVSGCLRKWVNHIS